MTTFRARRAARDAVSWRVVDESPALQRLLAHATAPAHADELAGLPAALDAFAVTRPRPRRHPVMSVLAKLVAVKAVLALAGATAVSGVALAAATGSLPATLQDAAHDAVGAPAASHPSPSATPSPDTTGLCRAYQAGVADAHGKATESPAFVALATAAGSADGVDAYCSALLADQPGGKPTDLPSQAASHQPAHPSGPPATHGAPDTHPTRAPVPHPTGPPAR